MIEKQIREIIYTFIINNNQRMTTKQITDAVRKLLLLDISEKTIERFMDDALGDNKDRKRGRPRKLG